MKKNVLERLMELRVVKIDIAGVKMKIAFYIPFSDLSFRKTARGSAKDLFVTRSR